MKETNKNRGPKDGSPVPMQPGKNQQANSGPDPENRNSSNQNSGQGKNQSASEMTGTQQGAPREDEHEHGR